MGVHSNQYKSVASLKLAVDFDLLNELCFSASEHPKQTSDLRCIEDKVKSKAADTMTIYDRGFGSILLLFLHQYWGSKCLIRIKVGFSNYTKNFLKTTDNEAVIEVPLGDKCVKELKKMEINRSAVSTIKVRLIRIILPSGETEVLMTNVPQSEMNLTEAGEIYGLRWGIETAFNYAKNVFKLGVFSGYSEVAILQDIWCNLMAQNLENVLVLEQESTLALLNSKRVEKYKINKAVGCETLLSQMKILLKCRLDSLTKHLNDIKFLFLKSLEKIKCRKRARTRKRQRPNDRHTTEKNYKHNF